MQTEHSEKCKYSLEDAIYAQVRRHEAGEGHEYTVPRTRRVCQKLVVMSAFRIMAPQIRWARAIERRGGPSEDVVRR